MISLHRYDNFFPSTVHMLHHMFEIGSETGRYYSVNGPIK